MGRTKRRRKRKTQLNDIMINSDNWSVALNQWLKNKGWENVAKLQLANCKTTGRGIISKKATKGFDILFQIPYELMITFTTIQAADLREFFLENRILKMHDVLAVYLALERHKGVGSKWKFYIDSLPNEVPLLPWLGVLEEINILPDWFQPDLLQRRWRFENSWTKTKESINPKWKSPCCSSKGSDVLSYDLFRWAYVMVNTRAIYVDPAIVRELSPPGNTWCPLSDDPLLALCPFLDMFNHSPSARTEVGLHVIREKQYHLVLKSAKAWAKRQQIFISYGDHDNITLLNEYGFFVPYSPLESIKFTFGEVLRLTGFKISSNQYKFVCEKIVGGAEKLFVDVHGLSFQIKAVVYVILEENPRLWSQTIFSDNYSTEMESSLYKVAQKLLEKYVVDCITQYERLKIRQLSSELSAVVNYFEYRIEFIQYLIELFSRKGTS